MDKIEKLKLEVLDYLADGKIKQAVDHVRSVAPILGLTGAYKFVKKVEEELTPALVEQDGTKQNLEKY